MVNYNLGPLNPYNCEELTLAPNFVNSCQYRISVCLYDANPLHHKNNLKLNGEGGYEGGCRACFNDFLPRLVLPANPSQFASVWRTLSPSQRETHIDTAESDHRNRGDINTMNDMKNEIEQGGMTLGREWHADKTYPVTSVPDVIDKLREVHRVHGEIHVVACVMHGVPNQFSLGGTIRVGQSVTDFVNQIKDFLAEDTLWILYACGTAGLGLGNGEARRGGHARLGLEITRGQEGGRNTVAAALHDALHAKGKVRAEVWGHTGYGNATQRPYWRRYREQGANAVSLFEMCFNEAFVNAELNRLGPHSPWNSANAVRAQMFNEGQFPVILRRALDELQAGPQGVRDIPLWSLVYADPEVTELPERCQAEWKRRRPRR